MFKTRLLSGILLVLIALVTIIRISPPLMIVTNAIRTSKITEWNFACPNRIGDNHQWR